jgi:HSP20 family protein
MPATDSKPTKGGVHVTALTEPFPPWLRDLNRFFNSEGTASSFVPPADVLVDADGVIVYMDVPGVSADQLDIELENDLLTVRGERPYPYAGDNGGSGAQRVERAFGRFERVLRVPRGLDPNAIDASLTAGVLSLRIPKPESAKPHRIPVKAAAETRQLDGGQPRQGDPES